MAFKKVNENLYLYLNASYYDVVVGALILPTQIIAIDSGMHIAKLKEFREYVENETKKKFSTLFLTHHHGDHTIGNQVFSDCRIIATEQAMKKMEKEKKKWTPERIENTGKWLKDSSSTDGLQYTLPTETYEHLEIDDQGIKVIFKQTGGHTDDSAYIHCPNYKILFAGDNLFESMFPYGQENTSNPDLWVTVLEEYLKLEAEYYIPGHQGICDKQIVKDYIQFIEKLKSTMLELHSSGKNEEEIISHCQELDPYESSKQFMNLKGLKNSTLKNWYKFWILKK